MKSNFNDIKQKILSGEEALVDGGYMSMDLESIFDYYVDDDDRPPEIEEYFKLHGTEYKFESFMESYISSLCGVTVKSEYTEDQWLRIFSIK